MDYQIKNKKILLVGCTGVLGSAFTEFLYENDAILILADLKTKKFLFMALELVERLVLNI